jgi:opacity protein-like surface antigen
MNRSFTLKALTAALILASTSGMVFAKGYKGDYKGEACPPPQMLKTGWYVGAQAGYDSYRVRENNTVGFGDGSGFASNPVYNGTGWVGGLFLGYGQMMNEWFYLGGEVFGNYSGVDQNTNYNTTPAPSITATTNFQVNGSYGLGLLPGIKMTDSTLTYIRLGWNWANLKSSASVNVPAAIFGTPAALNASGSQSNTSNGFVFGVGMETLIVDNWSLRGEFDHTWYSNYNANGSVAVPGAVPPAFVTASTSWNPSDNQYMLAAIYHFG